MYPALHSEPRQSRTRPRFACAGLASSVAVGTMTAITTLASRVPGASLVLSLTTAVKAAVPAMAIEMTAIDVAKRAMVEQGEKWDGQLPVCCLQALNPMIYAQCALTHPMQHGGGGDEIREYHLKIALRHVQMLPGGS